MEDLTSAIEAIDLNAKKRVRFCTSPHKKPCKRLRLSPEMEAKFYSLFGTDSEDEDIGPTFIFDEEQPTVDDLTTSLCQFVIGSN